MRTRILATVVDRTSGDDDVDGGEICEYIFLYVCAVRGAYGLLLLLFELLFMFAVMGYLFKVHRNSAV